MEKKIVKKQFNKQAEQFARYELTRNETIFQFTVDFCQFEEKDTLLDVACGSGAFAIFCARKLKRVAGVDISDELIKYAQNHAAETNLTNVEFICGDVEKIPFADASFSVASCRSAFHHIENGDRVLKEMVRCTKKGGRICIQDMTAYQQSNVNEFFEKMEKKVDLSHFRALSSKEIQELFSVNNIKIEGLFETVLTHNLNEYIGHAHQSKKQVDALAELINLGLNNHAMSEWLFYENEDIKFKRGGIIIWGTIL